MSECKSEEMDMNRLLRKMRQMNNPDYLHTVSLNELFDNVYESRPSIIDGLLYAGAYFLAGAPKIAFGAGFSGGNDPARGRISG